MTEQDVKRIIEAENRHLDYLYNETLRKCFNGRIPKECSFSDWFKFNQLWIESRAYEDSRAVQNHLRDAGYDVKMTMTNQYKLSYHGVIA